MIRTIIWVKFFIIRLIMTLPPLMKVKKLHRQNRIKEKDELIHKVAVNWSRSLIKASGAKVKVVGEENIPKNETVLFVSNHQSNFDIMLLLGFVPKHKVFIAKKELRKFPIVGTWMEYMNCAFIERGNPRKALRAINDGVKLLKEGYSLVVFPEGTRSEDGRLKKFKPGSLKLALKSGVPIVPITIKDAYKIMPKKKLTIRPANVEVIISPPIYKDDEVYNDTTKLASKLENIIGTQLSD